MLYYSVRRIGPVISVVQFFVKTAVASIQDTHKVVHLEASQAQK